ncbi:MAG: redoxin domain-containing protein [bacterium]|jgi:peroxiredoxin|nr:redoxin domain-containing protein [candidate division KSB1 bacterium]MDH7561298.1 redoxin domain-containing protein [bacterium]
MCGERGGWQEFAERLAAVKMIGVSADGEAPTASFAQRHGLRFPVAADPRHELLRLYWADYVPLVVLVDAEARVRLYQRYGERTGAAGGGTDGSGGWGRPMTK